MVEQGTRAFRLVHPGFPEPLESRQWGCLRAEPLYLLAEQLRLEAKAWP